MLVLAALWTGAGAGSDSLTPGGMAYVWYEWPQPLPVYWNGTQIGFYNFDVFLTIEKDPGEESYYYWAHQFHFKDGEGGYMGLQTNGFMQGRWVGKMAIFSIWNAKAAKPGPNSKCEYFTGEGEGWSCRLPYKWVEGHTYRLRLWELCCADKPSQNEWWGAWIMDMNTGKETFIGQIQIPASWQWLDWSVVWVEYFMPVSSCNEVPYAKARFDRPSADNGTFQPQKLTPDYGKKCPNVKVTLVSKQGAVLETGGSVSH